MSESSSPGTKNKLQHFDIAVAIAERAINQQLKIAWKQWTKHNGEVYPIQTKISQYNKPTRTLEISLGAPSLNLDTPDQRSVRVCFTITSGHMITFDEAQKQVDVDLKGVVFSFLSDLEKSTLAINDLYAHNPHGADYIKEMMGGANAGAFSIEGLFLRLTPRDVMTQFTSAFPESRGNLSEFTQTRLQELFWWFIDERGEAKFLLNTAVYPREPLGEPTFQLKDYQLHLTRAGKKQENQQQGVNTVNYLGVFFQGKKMPNDYQWIAGPERQGPWFFASQMDGTQTFVAGVMVIRGALVAQHFRNGLEAALKDDYAAMHAQNVATERRLGVINHPETELPHPEADLLKDAKWTVRDSDGAVELFIEQSYKWRAPGTEDPTDYNLSKTLTVTLVPSPGGGYEVSGKLVVIIRRERKVTAGKTLATGVSTSILTGKVRLRAMGDGIRCAVVPQVELSFGASENKVETATEGIGAWFAKIEWDKKIASGISDYSRNAIEKMLKSSIERANVTMSGFGFVPPGEEVFTFSNPQFTAEKDLMLAVTYKAPKPPKAT